MKKLLIILLLLVTYSLSSKAEPNFTYSTPGDYKFSHTDFTNNISREKILFIVDFSNSMNERLGHRTK